MNNAPNNPGQPEPVHRGRHERSDANVVVIALLGLSVLVQVAAVELVVTGMFDWLQRREAAGNPTLSPLSAPKCRFRRDCKPGRLSICSSFACMKVNY